MNWSGEFTKPLPYVNALRRAVVSMIPHAAIDHVQVEVNTTLHNDSFLIKTMEMLPIFDAPAQSLDVLLDVTCPPDRDMCTVDSHQLQVLAGDAAWLRSDVFLFHLQKGQRIRLRAKTSRGTPRDHVRYQVAHAGYRIVPRIVVPEMTPAARAELAALCCRSVFDGPTINEAACVACGDCVAKGVLVTPTDRVLFFIDSNAEPAAWVYRQALHVLQEAASCILSMDLVFADDGIVPNTLIWSMELPMTVAQLIVHELAALSPFHAVKQVHPLQPTLILRVGARDATEATRYVQEAALRVLETLQAWSAGI